MEEMKTKMKTDKKTNNKDNKVTNVVDEAFAIYILKLRKDNKLTQKEFADLINVSDRTISKWENGLSVPDLLHIRNISKAFGVSPNSIVLEKMSFRDYIRIFIKLIKKLSRILFNNIFKCIFIILFVLLIIFFLNNYNTVNIYSLTYSSDNITLENSYFIKTSNRNLLLINNINIDYINYEIDEIDLELYTQLNGDKIIIYKDDTLNDITISELNSYSDKLTRDVIKAMRKNLYLTIKTTDLSGNEYTYECTINLKEYFRNDKLIYFGNSKDKDNNVTNYIKNYDNSLTVNFNDNTFNNFVDSTVNLHNKTIDENVIDKDALSNLGYEYDSYNDYYFKSDGDKNITFQPKHSSIMINYKCDSINYNISYYYKKNKIEVETYSTANILLSKYKYTIENNVLDCLYGECQNYEDDINYILGKYQEILTIL